MNRGLGAGALIRNLKGVTLAQIAVAKMHRVATAPLRTM